MSTVHYIVLIDNENETYDTSLIMKTESVEEIDKKIVELKQEQLKQELKKDQDLHTYYVYITKTDDNYDGYVINNISSVSKIAEAVASDVSDASVKAVESVASDTSVKAVEPIASDTSDVASDASMPKNFDYLKIVDTAQHKNEISNENVIANKFKNYILIDPAGEAFLNNNEFIAGGLSLAIYIAFRLYRLNHNITLEPTQATLLKPTNIIEQNEKNKAQAVEARTLITERITGIIHAIGPNNQSQNMNDNTFYTQLTTTINSIITVILNENLNVDKSKIILLPMISAGIYGGNIRTNPAKFKAYLTNYILMIDKLHKDTGLQIHLMYYSEILSEEKVPEFLKEICNMQIENVNLSAVDNVSTDETKVDLDEKKVELNETNVETNFKLQPAQPAQQKIILLNTGAYAPVHKSHVQMIANAIEAVKEIYPEAVVTALMSPSHENYVGGKITDPSLKVFANGPIRIKLCEKLVSDMNLSEKIKVVAWESEYKIDPPYFPDFPEVIKYYTDLYNDDTIMYIMGADNYAKYRHMIPNTRVVVVPRKNAKGNVIKFTPIKDDIKSKPTEDESLSSTELRKYILNNKWEEVQELTSENVMKMIKKYLHIN